jgi:chromosome segregation ATPase
MKFEKARLTWRTFLHMLLFHVVDIARETSVIEPEQGTEKTAMLSALLFLLSGNDFAESDAQNESEIRRARKRAVEEYVNQKIQLASDKKKELQNNLNAFNGIDVEQNMQDIIDSLHITEAQISASVDQSRELLHQILNLQNRAAECDLLQSRYSSLKTQYVSDIKRLSFIVNGEVEMGHVPENQTCPFCEGKLPVRNKKTYIESAQAELNRIMVQINDLEEAAKDLQNEKAEIEKSLNELQSKKDQIESNIEKELQPKADALKQSIDEYRAYICQRRLRFDRKRRRKLTYSRRLPSAGSKSPTRSLSFNL